MEENEKDDIEVQTVISPGLQRLLVEVIITILIVACGLLGGLIWRSLK